MSKEGEKKSYAPPITPGDAYFILQGTPQKATQSEGYNTEVSETLVQFDLKFDSLRSFLESVTKVINQHASMLNKLTTEVGARVTLDTMTDIYRKVGTRVTLKDNDLNKVLFSQMEAPLIENTGNNFEDNLNFMCNKLETVSCGILHSQKKQKELTDAIRKNKEETAKKSTMDEVKEHVKKKKKKLKAKIEDLSKTLDDRIAKLEKSLSQRIDDLGIKFADVEKHTVWKIKDCEDLLRTRVNDQFVEDAVRKLETKLSNDLKKSTEGSHDQIQNMFSDTVKKIQLFEESIDEKVDDLKKGHKDLKEDIAKKLDLARFDDYRKDVHVRQDGFSEKVNTFSKRFDPIVERVTTEMAKLEQKFGKYESKLSVLSNNVENYILNGTAPQGMGGGSSNGGGGGKKKEEEEKEKRQKEAAENARRMQEMESFFNKYREDLQRNHQLLVQIQDEMLTKVDLGSFNLQMSKKLDKDEYIRFMSKMSMDEDKFKRAIELGDEIQVKLDKMTEAFDKKILKLKKEVDPVPLQKQLKTKAEDENVIKGFTNVDTKIQAVTEAISILKKDIETAMYSIRTVGTQMTKFSDTGLLTTKPIGPQNCLSCGGSTTNNLPPGTYNSKVKGSDGKLYRGDMKTYNFHEIVESRKESTSISLNLNKSVLHTLPDERSSPFFNSSSPRVKLLAGQDKKSSSVIRARPNVFSQGKERDHSSGSQSRNTVRPWSAKK